MATTQEVLAAMLARDSFTEWLGITIDEHRDGYCRLHYTIRPEMLNGFGIAHGGILFSAADSAFAFACNADGQLTVALDVTISFVKTATAGDVLSVEAREVHKGNKTGFYDITISNQHGDLIALFKGTGYRTGRNIVGE
jgi:acyl-CoA thioesterase